MTARSTLVPAAAALLVVAGCTPPELPPAQPGSAPPEPELVQPGVISTHREENFPTVDPVDGSLWFSSYEGQNFNRQTIMRAPREGGGWGAPAPVILAPGDEWGGRAPRFSPDGRRLYFTSNRPVVPGAASRDMNIWSVERQGRDGWGEPRPLPAPVNSDAADIHAAVTAVGDLFLASRRPGGSGLSDVYRIPRQGDGWGPAEHLGPPINDELSQPDLLVAPDGSWMVLVVTGHPQGLGEDDLFLSRFENGRWSPLEHLPAPINASGYEYGPTLSPDGTTLYFNSDRRGSADIYRIPLSALGVGRR
ncbi:MAG TPA: hypothetical protein VGR37_07415 [Longimicrobiaceae bacterium]|nr:hypothetical protein [Longimicrobiaceae bacterium]